MNHLLPKAEFIHLLSQKKEMNESIIYYELKIYIFFCKQGINKSIIIIN